MPQKSLKDNYMARRIGFFDQKTENRAARVDIWTAQFGALGPFRPGSCSLAEQAHAAKFRHPIDGKRYLLSRQFLHETLRRYHPTHLPEAVVIERWGKPRLNGGDLEFNLTHTHAAIFVAISNVPVGIDAEPFSRAVELKDIAPRILTKAEAQKWPDVPTQLDLELALQHWVGKEAYLKGVGCGLQVEPQRVALIPFRRYWLAGLQGRLATARPVVFHRVSDHLVAVSAAAPDIVFGQVIDAENEWQEL